MKKGRMSSNLVDIRDPRKAADYNEKEHTKIDMARNHKRQIFRKPDSEKLTKIMNERSTHTPGMWKTIIKQ